MRVRLKLDRLLDLVARSRISQNHWAIRLGISRGHWSAILNGRYPFPSPKTRARMLEVFGVEFSVLFDVDSGPEGDADATFQAAIADRYLIDREIGQGGMGTVYLARDVKHGRPVALKVISPEAVGGIGIPQFLRETRFAARLQHPNILPVYDSGEAAGSPFYVTPLIDGGSLRDLLRHRGTLPLPDVLQIADDIAQALSHAHERQILHCDIKPENILLSGEGRHRHAWVADFGISRVIHAETREWARRGELDSSAGTPAYVSPEQASGESNLTAAADVYSLACMLFECLAGAPPFPGTTTMEVVSRRFVGAVPNVRRFAPAVPRETAAVMQSAMAVSPTARPATPVTFVAQLEESIRRPRPAAFQQAVTVTRRLLGGAGRLLPFTPSRKRQRFMDRLAQDLGYAVRSLLRRPLFALIVLATLGLGIGMNTAIFSVLYGVLYRPLGYGDPSTLVRIGRTRPELPNVLLPISPAAFLDFQSEPATLSRFEAATQTTYVLTERGDAARIRGARVTSGFLDLLGVPPVLGRVFREEDNQPGTEPVVVVSYGFWQNRLGADPNVIGSTIRLDDSARTVIGVMPSKFEFSTHEIWTPFIWTESAKTVRNSNYLQLYGRLAPGVGIEQAVSEANEIWTRLGEDWGDYYDESGMSLIPLREAFVGRSRPALLILGGSVMLVLLIACANVANLLLARAEVRQREIAVRAALGATRGRLARQFLTESVLISLLGGALGVLLAWGGVRLLVGAYASAIPRSEEIGIQGLALLFALLVAVGTGLVVGLVPAIQARPDHEALKEGSRGSSGRVTLLRQGLVAGEIALAVMLLTGAGLLIRSFWNALQADLGFEQENMMAANFWFPESRYQSGADVEQFLLTLESRLEANPAIQSVSMTSMVPIRSFGNNFTRLNVVGDEERQAAFVESRRVTPDYFESMGVALIRGRVPDLAEARERRSLIVINRELARQLFGNDRDPLGQHLDLGRNPPEIVGVVDNVRSFGPDERPRPTVYFLLPVETNVMIRASRDIAAIGPLARRIASEIDPAVALVRLDPMSDIISRSLGSRRFQLTLIGTFAAAALVLGAVGVFGVMSYTVERQTREIGVRMALGARSSDVLQLVLRRTGQLALIGVAAGLVGAYGLRQTIASLLFDVETLDPLVYGGVAAGLFLIALLAGFLPARRASIVEPTQALRYE